MILTVTLNAALDKTLIVPGLRLGAVNRPCEVVSVAGGKGLNVTRVLHGLGEEVLATGLVAGEVGRQIEALLVREGVRHAFHRLAAGESRTCTAIVDEAGGGTPTELIESGPCVSVTEFQRYTAGFVRLLPQARWVVLSGSLPPQLSGESYLTLMVHAQNAGVRVSLDTSGEALATAIAGAPEIIKPNQEEAEALLGAPIRPEGLATALTDLLALGPRVVALTLGARGAVVADRDEAWFLTTPEVPVVSPIGSGDAFLAALISARLNGRPLADAGRWAVAAGTANAMVPGAAAVTPLDIAAVYPRVGAWPITEAAWAPADARRSS